MTSKLAASGLCETSPLSEKAGHSDPRLVPREGLTKCFRVRPWFDIQALDDAPGPVTLFQMRTGADAVGLRSQLIPKTDAFARCSAWTGRIGLSMLASLQP